MKKYYSDYIKAYEPWVNVFFAEPIAIPMVPVLAAIRVSPNMLTTLSLLTGLLSGLAFATGHWFWAALVFQLTCFLDAVDGKLARYSKKTSEFGAKLDLVADATRKPASFLGIAIYFYVQGQPALAFLTATALVVHVGVHKLFNMAGVLEYDLEFPNFIRKVVRRIAPRIIALYTFFEEQFFEFVVFPIIAVAVGLPDGAVWFLYGAIFVTVLGLAKLAILMNHRKKGRYAHVYQDWAGTKGKLDKV